MNIIFLSKVDFPGEVIVKIGQLYLPKELQSFSLVQIFLTCELSKILSK